MSFAGGFLGLLLGHGITGIGSHYIYLETGLKFSAAYVSRADIYLLPLFLLFGIAAGLIPALQAYRLSVSENLSPVS